MSQAVVDFCETLKSTLLTLEARLDKAKTALACEAHEHVDAASKQLAEFKQRAAQMAQSLREQAPEPVKARLQEFGLEAQTAMRHAVIFLAETASGGAEAASDVLHDGSRKAHALADDLRRDTALTVTPSNELEPTAGTKASQ